LRARASQSGTATERLDRYLDWYADRQIQLRDEFGFVPGHFHMAIDITVPDAILSANLYRAEAKAILDTLLKVVLKDRRTSPDTINWLADTIGHIIGGLMIEARLSNSLDTVFAIKPTILRLIEHITATADPGAR
jgi:hypothetical protein